MGLYRHMIDVPIFLIASRDGVSNSNPRIISEAKGLKMANDLKNCHYFEVCSENGFNVELVFHEACQKILTSRQAPTSSSSLSLSSTNYQAPMNSLHRGSNKAFHTQLSSPVNISSSALSASSYSSYDDVSKDFVATPNTTPTPSRKNNRRRSNIFTSKKDCDDKKLRNGDAKLGSGRVIPIKQGWLYKKSSKPLSKDWQKKYVTLLDDGRMTYHSSLHDYMENSHGKEIKLGETTVKIPGQGPRGSGLTRTNNNNIAGCHISRHSEANNFMSPACVLNSVSTGTSVSSSTTTIPPKLETPINKKKHRRIKSNSRNFDGSESSEYGYEFAIVSLDNKQWLFEACSLEEREEWIIAVEQQILSSLQQNRSSKAQITSSANIAVIHAVRNVSGNNECADCAAPNPEWASLNLGALICIECSGIHRNLGTHLSRVRSLELDEWPPNLVEVMTSIGNDLLNSVYEANAIGCKKPNPTSSREEKDKWIRMKYELKNYLPPLPFEGVPIQQQLMDAVACNNVHNLILVLAYCSPNDVNTPYNSTTDTRTALHIAAAFGKIILVQLLLWYGANPDLVDHENHTPSFYAREHKAFECLKILEMVTSQ
ncbi:hypothetical protein HELRODRAFT_109375 [Helobdella robusta]|uniref:Centaurin-gamma-1A n=1 Tax=Helobdella robusta TaxID=6412 RepID=T1EES9_HELRO|nr:hypothetical protein HELRODRAFT_109375 [Helobdella robusta]ESO09977.1 hypothetical protein HELRODRAFT_109375 [Helobdella robusta]